MSTDVKKKVVIFEDNKHLRESLFYLVNSSPLFECLSAYSNTDNIIEHLAKDKPAVVLMDIEMPGMNGIDATRLLKKDYPEIKVLMLTVFDDAEKIFQALCAGGSGYLLKNSYPEQILQAIQDVNNGGTPLSPGVARYVVQFFQNNFSEPEQDYHITPREREVLQSLVEGRSYKMIAAHMDLSVETVKTHLKNIYSKLHVNSSPEAVSKALRQKIV